MPLWPPGTARRHDQSMRVRRIGPIAVLVAVVATVVAAWVSWLDHGYTFVDSTESYLLTNSAIAVTFGSFGALVLWFRPGHRVGWLFAGVSACYGLSTGCLGVLAVDDLPSATERVVDIVGITAWAPAAMILLPLIAQLFPDGRALSPRWRILGWLTVGIGSLSTALSTPAPPSLQNEPIADNRPILPAAAGRIVDAMLPYAMGA